jgi:hypothetical protein
VFMVDQVGPPDGGGTLCGVSGKWKTGRLWRESEFVDMAAHDSGEDREEGGRGMIFL